MADTLDIFGKRYTNVTGIIATNSGGTELTFTRGGGQPTLQTKTATYTPTTSQQTATITADTGYDGLEEVDVTVNAIPSNYVDTSDANATQYSLLDGATAYVNGVKITGVIPQMTQYTGDMSQYFHTENNQRKWSFEGIIRTSQGGMVNPGASFSTGEYTYNAVPANTTITPTTSSQTVGGANYMMEGAVTVSAMPTGSAGTPTAIKGTVSNHSVTVTPSVTNTTGYITGSTKTGTAVTVTASELVSGSETKTANGTYDVTNLASLVVNVSGSTGKNVQAYRGYDTVNVNTYTATDVTLTVAKTGTYNISWMGFRNTTSGTSGSQLYKNGSAVGTASTTFVNSYGHSVSLTNQSLNQGDVLVVRARARNSSYVMGVGNLIIQEV